MDQLGEASPSGSYRAGARLRRRTSSGTAMERPSSLACRRVIRWLSRSRSSYGEPDAKVAQVRARSLRATAQLASV